MFSKRIRDAEETRKRIVLRNLLKKVVRGVIINSQWLDGEHDNDQNISANVKRNIALLMRTTRKTGLLTSADKSMLRTPQNVRTVAERKKLCHLFIELRCFYWIPPKLRARMVPVVKFMSVSGGREIMKQNDWPITIYFIITGEVEMLRTIGGKAASALESKEEIIFGPGDCIGDIAFLEDCPRTYSFIATSQCDLLVLFDNDFKTILQPYMQKLWNDKKRALKALDYFDFLTDEQILKACKLCTLKEYKPLETIYSHDRGTLTNVHFVLSGECVILQCLNMKVHSKGGKKIYELLNTSNYSSMTVFNDINTNGVMNKGPATRSSTEFSKSRKFLRDITHGGISINTVVSPPLQVKSLVSQMSISYKEYLEEHFSCVGAKTSSENQLNGNASVSESYENFESGSCETENSARSSSVTSSLVSTDISNGVESHFIDVGTVTFGGIFGLGEEMNNRVIMARTTVHCLLLPRFFLLDTEQNPENVWQHRLFSLDCIIPSRETLFDDYLKTLKWKKFKFDCIKQNLTSKSSEIANGDDIPILCRIEESS